MEPWPAAEVSSGLRKEFLLSALATATLCLIFGMPADPTPDRADGIVEASPLAQEACDPAAPNALGAAAETVLASMSTALGQSCDDNACYEYCTENGFSSGLCVGGFCWCY